jgi:hypothetical protein
LSGALYCAQPEFFDANKSRQTSQIKPNTPTYFAKVSDKEKKFQNIDFSLPWEYHRRETTGYNWENVSEDAQSEEVTVTVDAVAPGVFIIKLFSVTNLRAG